MKFNVYFKLQPDLPYTKCDHVFNSEKSADLYADAILKTSPILGFQPEAFVEPAECRSCGRELKLDEACYCMGSSRWALSDLAFDSIGEGR